MSACQYFWGCICNNCSHQTKVPMSHMLKTNKILQNKERCRDSMSSKLDTESQSVAKVMPTQALFCHQGDTLALFCHQGDTLALFCHQGDTLALFCRQGDTVALFCHQGDTLALFCHQGNTYSSTPLLRRHTRLLWQHPPQQQHHTYIPLQLKQHLP